MYRAHYLARQLMNRHGLSDWAFGFDHARRRFGSCRCGSKRITLSRPLTLLNTEEQVRNTILHEIAHALTPGAGHGARWRQKCREIGAEPARCYTEDEVISPARAPAPYRFGCAACGWWVERRRRSRRNYVCARCRGPVTYQINNSSNPAAPSILGDPDSLV